MSFTCNVEYGCGEHQPPRTQPKKILVVAGLIRYYGKHPFEYSGRCNRAPHVGNGYGAVTGGEVDLCPSCAQVREGRGPKIVGPPRNKDFSERHLNERKYFRRDYDGDVD